MKKVYLRQIVLLCLLASVSIGVMVNCTGLFFTPVCENLHFSQGAFSMTSTISLLISALFSFFIPVLLYTYPVKRLVLIGLVLSAGSTALMGMVSSLPLFYLLSVLRGLGMGLFSNTVLTTIISNWFYEKSALVTSIVMSFSGVAGAVLSPILGSIMESTGWRLTYIILSLICVLLVLPSLLLPFRAFPLDMSQLPYGFKEEEIEETSLPQQRFSYLSPLFLCLVLICFLCALVTGMGSFISGFGLHSGLSIKTASALLSFTMAGNIAGKLIIGMLAGKLGPIKASFVMSVITVAGLLLLMLCPMFGWLPLYFLASFLYGAVFSLAAVSSSMLTRYFYGPVLYVKAFAVIGFTVIASSAIALPIIGFLYDTFNSYQMVFLAGICVNALYLFLLAAAARMARENQ